MAGLTFALCAMGWPAGADAAGCEVLQGPRDRAECSARQAAREQARAEVARKVEATPGTSTGAGADRSHSDAWDRALHDARGAHPADLVEPRPLAAVVGLAWFGLVARSRLRARRRHRRPA